MNERQSLQWEDLNQERRPKMRAGHFYQADDARAPGSPAGRKPRLLLAAVALVPLAVFVIQSIAAALGG